MIKSVANMDFSIISLNATSIATLVMGWFTGNLESIGGFILVLSMALLNVAKSYKMYKESKKNEHSK
jgi:hypothetical protein